MAAGASSSRIVNVERSTTEGVVIIADTTDGSLTTKGEGYGKLDPPAC